MELASVRPEDGVVSLNWGLIVAVVLCIEFWIALTAFVLGL